MGQTDTKLKAVATSSHLVADDSSSEGHEKTDREKQCDPPLETNENKMTGPVRVILLACGSYNPITNMHLRMFELARDTLNRSGRYKVIGGIISPVNDAYNKKELVGAKHRCAMVRAALKSSDWIKIDTWECEQDAWQTTAMVIAHHRKHVDVVCSAIAEEGCDNMSPSKRRKPNKRHKSGAKDERSNSPLNIMNAANLNESSGPVLVKLLCGADLLETFAVPGLWTSEDIEYILSGGIVCITRAETNPEKFIYESDVLTRYESNIHIVREWISNDISSTKIRRSLRRNESVKYLLQDLVIHYIKEHDLYSNSNCDNRYTSQKTPSPRDQKPCKAPGTNSVYPSDLMNANNYPHHVPRSITGPITFSPRKAPSLRTVYFSPSVDDDKFEKSILYESNRTPNTSGYQTSSSETSPDKFTQSPPGRKPSSLTDISAVVKRIRRVTIAPETCV